MAYTKNPGTVVLFLFLIISSCKDEVEKPLPNTNGHRVLISNEGNFGWGAGSLSSYNPSSKEVENELYKRINGEEPGNVFQSICKINKQYFLVMNNSQSIIVCDSQFKKTGTITGFNSPRYMHKISESKAYVTDLYADKIWIVSLEELKITGSIAVSGWCENGIVFDEEFWLCNTEKNLVYVINSSTDQIEDSITVGFAPKVLFKTSDTLIWVLCRGDGINNKCELSVLKTFNRTKFHSVIFDKSLVDMCYAASQNILFLMGFKVYKMIPDTGASLQIFAEPALTTPYAIAFDETAGEIYLSDVFDYTQSSSIFRFSATGSQLDEFKTGIISGGFHFN